VCNLPSNINGLNFFVPNLKALMKYPLFLETETGKLAIADIFTCSQQLFLVIFLITNNLRPILVYVVA